MKAASKGEQFKKKYQELRFTVLADRMDLATNERDRSGIVREGGDANRFWIQMILG